jgi:hypothetical protein
MKNGGRMKNRKLAIAIVLGLLAQLVYADELNDCLFSCLETYKQCIADRNPMDQCQLAQKNCEQDCRAKY